MGDREEAFPLGTWLSVIRARSTITDSAFGRSAPVSPESWGGAKEAGRGPWEGPRPSSSVNTATVHTWKLAFAEIVNHLDTFVNVNRNGVDPFGLYDQVPTKCDKAGWYY